jgi:glycosyltransferase involved in cell wall biosynthesis
MSPSTPLRPAIAVAIPCYQEAITIGKVVADFRRELPDAAVYVYDNGCTDATAEIAARAGAIVRREKRPGKGHVIATIFEQVREDILVIVDGDDTYEASRVHQLLDPILRGDADMSVGARQADSGPGSFRPLHQAGNSLVCAIINLSFGSRLTDVFSGFRVVTRDFARRIPLTNGGFDIETELTLQALYRRQVIEEIPVPYRARPEGSFSKLHTFRDGLRVLLRLAFMIKTCKPLTFFGGGALLLLLIALGTGIHPVQEIVARHRLHDLPAALAAGVIFLLALVVFALVLILHIFNLRLLEFERLLFKNSGRP